MILSEGLDFITIVNLKRDEFYIIIIGSHTCVEYHDEEGKQGGEAIFDLIVRVACGQGIPKNHTTS
jgi:hypothetical protein